MTPQAVLIEARRLIAEKGWTQGDWRMDALGRYCNADQAVAFCAIGAIDTVRPSWNPKWSAEAQLLERVTKQAVVQWNDEPGRTKEEVLSAFDKAIELAGASA